MRVKTPKSTAEIVQEVYRRSQPQGMGFLHFREGDLSEEAVAKLVEIFDHDNLIDMDYVSGRACKFSARRADSSSPWVFRGDSWYDHSDSQCEELKRILEATPVTEPSAA